MERKTLDELMVPVPPYPIPQPVVSLAGFSTIEESLRPNQLKALEKYRPKTLDVEKPEVPPVPAEATPEVIVEEAKQEMETSAVTAKAKISNEPTTGPAGDTGKEAVLAEIDKTLADGKKSIVSIENQFRTVKAGSVGGTMSELIGVVPPENPPTPEPAAPITPEPTPAPSKPVAQAPTRSKPKPPSTPGKPLETTQEQYKSVLDNLEIARKGTDQKLIVDLEKRKRIYDEYFKKNPLVTATKKSEFIPDSSPRSRIVGEEEEQGNAAGEGYGVGNAPVPVPALEPALEPAPANLPTERGRPYYDELMERAVAAGDTAEVDRLKGVINRLTNSPAKRGEEKKATAEPAPVAAPKTTSQNPWTENEPTRPGAPEGPVDKDDEGRFSKNAADSLEPEKPRPPKTLKGKKTATTPPGIPVGPAMPKKKSSSEVDAMVSQFNKEHPSSAVREKPKTPKAKVERLNELDSIIDKSLDVMKGASRSGNQEAFDIAGEMMMKARNEAVRLRSQETTPIDTAKEKQERSNLYDQKIAQLTLERERTTVIQPMEAARIEDDIKKLKYERDQLNQAPSWFSKLKTRTKELYGEAKKKAKGGWEKSKGARGFLWERIKGISTVGIYEALQGERVRRGGKEVAGVVAEGAKDIWTEKMLWEQAEILARRYAGEGATTQEAVRAISRANLEFLAPMRERNEKHIDATVAKAMAVYDVKMAKARTTWRGETAQERRGAVEAGIRKALKLQQDNLTTKQAGDYVAVVRETFDPSWKARYGLAALEAVLVGFGINFIASNFLMTGAATAPGVPASPAAVAKAIEVKMHSTIWGTLKQQALQHGVALQDPQLMDLTQKVLVDNNLVEPQWITKTVNGISTRMLPEGFPVIFSPLIQKALGMAVV